MQLLRRERPKVTATSAGKLFVARARTILAEVSSATDELASLRGHTIGDVSFGATIPAATVDIPGLIATFRDEFPGVRVRLREGTGAELVDMVKADIIDLGVVSTDPDDLPAGATGTVIDHDDLILAGPPGHPLADRQVVRVEELDGVDLISFREGAGLRTAADEVLASAGATPNIVIESNEMPVLVGLVSRGIGLAILPRAFIANSTEPIWSCPLQPPIRPALTLVWREGRRRSPAAEAFLRHIQASRASIGTD